MATHQTPAQRDTVERVMHEFKHGELKTAAGKKNVKNPKQAIAIALHEAGASKNESPKKNAQNLRRTKGKERKGETGRDAAEGHGKQAKAKPAKSQAKSHAESGHEKTRKELYEEAKRRDLPGRSKMNKEQLEHALHA